MAPARPRHKTPSIADQHAEWLTLLRPDGPFLALPVLTEAFPQGLEAVPDDTRKRLRQAWTEVSEAPDLLGPAWQDLVFTELLRHPASMLSDGAALADEVSGTCPDTVLSGPNASGGTASRLHIYRRVFGDELTKSVRGEPALVERAAQVCRDTGVPLALLTNGGLWVLVHAKPGEPTTTASFDADMWFEEPVLLRAFVTLLCATRVLPPPADAQGEPSTSLAGLFTRSAAAQAQVTTTLGLQVRQAVELLVDELARLDREARGALLADVSERDIYRGALTVLMRLVFLLYAEEQRLLPINDELYAEGYAVSTLFDALEAERSLHGDEVGDRRRTAWPRLLALFGAVHGGCEHPDLRIPAHGGSLLDPHKYPWLAQAEITDRVVREILDALLVLKHRGGQAPERLSYRGLDVEQIGHVYEGLLEFSCCRVDEPFLGLIGKNEPEVPLTELESVAVQGEDRLRSSLRETCGLTSKQLSKALAATPDVDQMGALHAACDNDAALAERIRPYWGLLRIDLRDEPTVFPAGSVLFTQVGDRRATGTHYTPRSLAEEIVEHALAPLCFEPGPAQGADRAEWQVKSAEKLLDLKVCDPAMGSGAFLVSACRYLAQRMVEAWERDGVPGDVAQLVNGADDREGLLLTARRMVASRCLYGVDRDDMAVELAKLSLWLITLAKNRPFGFVDHALRLGDSLVGVLRTEQLVSFHLDPERGRKINGRLSGWIDERIEAVLTKATVLREEIEATVVQDPRQAEEKAEKLKKVEQLTERLRVAADAVVGAALVTAGSDSRHYDGRLTSVADEMLDYLNEPESHVEKALRDTLTDWLYQPRPYAINPFHWPLEFPEVISRGGFDAVVSNPPFVGGQRLTAAIGRDVREHLVEHLGGGKRGSADLCSYFLLRNVDISFGGRVGIIATNTIAQGDTREVGLDQIRCRGRKVYRAVKSQPWPGTASLEVSLVWVAQSGSREVPNLDGRPVRAITTSLDPESRMKGSPHRLVANENQSFQGSTVLGTGFIMEPQRAQELIAKDPRNAEVLLPYLNGEDLNSRADCSASRWVINFYDWPKDRAKQYEDCFAIVERYVKPERLRNRYSKTARERWWQYERTRPELYSAIAKLDRVLVIALVSRLVMPSFVSARQVLAHKLGVFATDRAEYMTLLSSAMHSSWAWKYSSTMKADLNYSPSDVYETFPRPGLTERMRQIGEELHRYRRSLMLEGNLGLTKLYKVFHDSSETDAKIRTLRDVHVEVDNAVVEAYGWTDLHLGHGFYEVRQGRRFTIDPVVQVEVLDRLLELNHQRYAEEATAGLHDKKGKGKRKRATPSPGLAFEDGGLFPPDDALF